jgi:TPR repeat protein
MKNNFIHRKKSLQKLSTCLILMFFLFIGVSQALADFEKGLLALRKGDYTSSFREFRSLAEHGHAKSQLQLGIMYEMGLGTEKDYSEAAKWYQKAAIKGEKEAQKRLLEMKKKGRNANSHPPIPENYTGNITEPQTQFDIGVMYYKGIGKPNSSKAYTWFLEAAEQGCADAQFNLGLQLSSGEGKGMPRHYSLAYMWFEIAGQNGIPEAREKQAQLAKLMREDQIEVAKIRASEWHSKHETEK